MVIQTVLGSICNSKIIRYADDSDFIVTGIDETNVVHNLNSCVKEVTTWFRHN